MFRFCGYDWECCMEGGRIIHPDYPYVYYDKENIAVCRESLLMLGLTESEGTPVNYWDGTVYYPEYGGGLLRSVNTFGYGTYSAEIMIAKGKGLWPSFWLCGEGRWPDGGEIDVEEGYTDHCALRITTPYFPWINPSWTTTTNIHYAKDGKHTEAKPRSVSIFKQWHNPANNYIKYECKWTPDEITFSVNGKVIRKDTEAVKYFPKDNPQMRVIFDLLCEDPAKHKIEVEQDMYVRNFKYESL